MVKRLFFVILTILLQINIFGQNEAELIVVVETPPVFDGDLEDFINKNIEYPLSAIQDSIEGVVFVSFYIDTLGYTFNHHIQKGVRADLNEEALRVTKLVKFVSAAKQRGKAIIVNYIVPVRFSLNNEQYSIIADSKEDSLFCAKYCPFYDFDSKENIIGITIPDQIVSLPEDNMIQLLDATQIILESTFGYNPQGLPLVLYVVVDNTGIVRGIIVDTGNHQSKRSEDAAHVAFNYLKRKKFIPASLRGKPITYGFSVLAKINEENKVNNNEIGVVTEPTSWPNYQNDQYYRELTDFVKDNLHYEDTITITQTVHVRFIVDTLGNTHHHEIAHSESPALNDEALRICRLIRFANPAMQRDRPVSVWFQVPVKFEPK